MKKIKRRLPSQKIVIRKVEEKPGLVRCAKCGQVLHGFPKVRGSGLGRIAKSEKTVNRPFGGFYCSGCTREVFKEKSRMV